MKKNRIEQDRNQRIESRMPIGSERSESMPYLGAAVPVGLVGAAAVAIYVLMLDVLAGHAFGTPNALGAVLLRGEAFSLDAPIRPGLVLGYTLLHGATFVAIAAAAVSAEFTLSRQGVSLPIQLTSGVIGIFVGLQFVFVMLAMLLGISWAGQLGFERIVVANVIAAFSMALTVYLRGEARRAARVPVYVR